MKKLNRKGFTLIELLAVIVILAIVMGVAANAVLNVMNNSRKNTLQSSAKSAADAFRTAYAEYQIQGGDSILGISTSSLISTTPKTVNLEAAAESLGISKNNYTLTESWVYFNPDTSVFHVCLTANPSGSYWLETAKSSSEVSETNSLVKKKLNSGTMWACSNDTHSWTD